MRVRVKRIHDPPAPDDGVRVLVDRYWPRGIKEDRAAVDDWRRELAPSDELRRWFGHDPIRWEEFRRRYLRELRAHREALGDLRRIARTGRLTLLYAARDERHNNARVLAHALRRGLPAEERGAWPGETGFRGVT